MKAFQFALRLYLRHLIGILLGFLLAFPFVGLLDMPYLFGAITAIISLALIYSGGWNAGFRDARKIPGFYPDKILPVKAAVIFFIFPFVLYLLRVFFPTILPMDFPVTNGTYQFFLTGNYVSGTPDFIYKIWFFPYNAFMGNGNLLVYAFLLFVEPMVSIIGYHIGLTRFTILGFLHQKIVYTNRKTKE